MLIQFTVENYLSFKDKTVFSMLAGSDESHPAHLIREATGKKKNIVRASALYGANASGKSNLVKAMKFAQNLILNGSKQNDRIGVSPFKLVKQIDPVSRFQFIFAHDGIEYSYGFALNSTRIEEEFLYATINTKETKYFERITNGEGDTEVEFGASLTRGGKDRKNFLHYKAKDTRQNQLFLTNVFEGNVKEAPFELTPAIEWFRRVLLIIDAESVYVMLGIALHKSENLREFASSYLSNAGSGIVGVTTIEEIIDTRQLFQEDEPEAIKLMFQSSAKLREGKDAEEEFITLQRSDGKQWTLGKNKAGQIYVPALILQHEDENEEIQHTFESDEESDGTQRLVNLLPILFDIHEGRERVVVIDELDVRLHPHLSKMIVKTAMQCQSKSQLIFTTHDTHLLDLDLLRRDEIWFVEKQKGGNSSLYSLAEFKIRPDLQVEKGYLNGRFGAIPFIGDIGSLGWKDKTAEVEEARYA